MATDTAVAPVIEPNNSLTRTVKRARLVSELSAWEARRTPSRSMASEDMMELAMSWRSPSDPQATLRELRKPWSRSIDFTLPWAPQSA